MLVQEVVVRISAAMSVAFNQKGCWPTEKISNELKFQKGRSCQLFGVWQGWECESRAIGLVLQRQSRRMRGE